MSGRTVGAQPRVCGRPGLVRLRAAGFFLGLFPPLFPGLFPSAGPLAQSAEQETFNLLVVGSSPTGPTDSRHSTGPDAPAALRRRVSHAFLAARLRARCRRSASSRRFSSARASRRTLVSARRRLGRQDRLGAHRPDVGQVVRGVRELGAVVLGVLAHQGGPMAAVQRLVPQPRRQRPGVGQLGLGPDRDDPAARRSVAIVAAQVSPKPRSGPDLAAGEPVPAERLLVALPHQRRGVVRPAVAATRSARAPPGSSRPAACRAAWRRGRAPTARSRRTAGRSASPEAAPGPVGQTVAGDRSVRGGSTTVCRATTASRGELSEGCGGWSTYRDETPRPRSPPRFSRARPSSAACRPGRPPGRRRCARWSAGRARCRGRR